MGSNGFEYCIIPGIHDYCQRYCGRILLEGICPWRIEVFLWAPKSSFVFQWPFYTSSHCNHKHIIRLDFRCPFFRFDLSFRDLLWPYEITLSIYLRTCHQPFSCRYRHNGSLFDLYVKAEAYSLLRRLSTRLDVRCAGWG